MELQTQTAEQWVGVLADLETKRQAALDHAEQLRAQKRDLALEAAMGSGEAKKQLGKINSEITRLALEGDDFDAAISQAESQLSLARQAEADAAEQERQSQIAASLELYFAEVQGIDAALASLVAQFAAAKAHLDTAEDLMTGQERTPVQQLYSTWGPTLAAAHYGLGQFIELGQSSSHIIHRAPLAKFAMSFIDRWMAEPPEEPDKEAA
jgi:hypothetical protein